MALALANDVMSYCVKRGSPVRAPKGRRTRELAAELKAAAHESSQLS